MCIRLCVCVPHKRFLGNCWSSSSNLPSVTKMHVLIICTDQNHENIKGLIISETIISIKAMPLKFTLQIVRLKVYMTIASTFIQGQKCVSNWITF